MTRLTRPNQPSLPLTPPKPPRASPKPWGAAPEPFDFLRDGGELVPLGLDAVPEWLRLPWE